MYDLLITGGTLADGTGAATFTGDIGIKDGVITAIGKLGGRARDTIDADGALVTPGFVDVHTHYDGQYLWDDKLDPSFSNGITTVVAGNCGVGFAPVNDSHRDRLIELMEGVEDIPEIVLNAGLDWNWRSFPEYMDRLAERSYSMDIATQIPHAPVRVFVMGERALNHEPATADDLVAMGKIVEEGMAAGALGVSGSRILEHLSSKGAHVPGTFAHEDELLTLARAMGKSGRGTFQIVPLGTVGARMDKELDDAKRREEHLRMEAIARAANRPITYILQQFESHPEDWRMMLDEATQSAAAGYQMKPQIAARGFGILTLLEGWHAFQSRPSYMKLAHLPLSERARIMRDPAVRAAILSEQDVPAEQAVSERVAAMVQHFRKRLHRQYLMDASLDYEPAPEQSLAAIAQATGKSMEELMYDHLVSNDGNGVAADFSLNYAHSNLDVAYDMLRHPHTITGLADGGAHMRMIADASLSSFHLTFWARDRKRGPTLPVEFLVKKHTLDTAQLYGFTDRGTLQVGQRADVNVIDFQNLKLDMPYMAYDLPGGGGRLLQGATGYLATIAGGQTTRRFDQDTGARPGRLVRGGMQ